MRLLSFSLYALSSLLIAGCGADQTSGPSAGGPSAGGAAAGCMSRAYETIGGPFSLTMHTGERVSEATFIGQPTLVYFGFTYCPDICPATLVSVKKAYEFLPDGVSPPQTLLITIDPGRDTSEALAQYVTLPAFPDNLIGLTGTEAEIKAVADAFIADYQRIESPESLIGYTMDHSSLLYLMDENWQLKTFFAKSDQRPQDMAACLAQHLD